MPFNGEAILNPAPNMNDEIQRKRIDLLRSILFLLWKINMHEQTKLYVLLLYRNAGKYF